MSPGESKVVGRGGGQSRGIRSPHLNSGGPSAVAEAGPRAEAGRRLDLVTRRRGELALRLCGRSEAWSTAADRVVGAAVGCDRLGLARRAAGAEERPDWFRRHTGSRGRLLAHALGRCRRREVGRPAFSLRGAAPPALPGALAPRAGGAHGDRCVAEGSRCGPDGGPGGSSGPVANSAINIPTAAAPGGRGPACRAGRGRAQPGRASGADRNRRTAVSSAQPRVRTAIARSHTPPGKPSKSSPTAPMSPAAASTPMASDAWR